MLLQSGRWLFKWQFYVRSRPRIPHSWFLWSLGHFMRWWIFWGESLIGCKNFDFWLAFKDLDIYIIPPYWIVAIGVFLSGVITVRDPLTVKSLHRLVRSWVCLGIPGKVISSLFGLVEKVQTSLEGILDVRKEDPWNNKEMIFYFFIILMMFFCVADMGKFPEFWNQNP